MIWSKNIESSLRFIFPVLIHLSVYAHADTDENDCSSGNLSHCIVCLIHHCFDDIRSPWPCTKLDWEFPILKHLKVQNDQSLVKLNKQVVM
jgi:hypothetical protein